MMQSTRQSYDDQPKELLGKHPAQSKVSKWKSYHPNDGLTKYGGRDLMGPGAKQPCPIWPNGAKVALNFCIHFEEGSEQSILHGDSNSNDISSNDHNAVSTGTASEYDNNRNLIVESLYEYGARAGFWRLHRAFTKRKLTYTFFAVGMALERNPAICNTIKSSNEIDIASQGYRHIDYQNINLQTECEHMDRSVAFHDRKFEQHPSGFFHPKPTTHTRQLVVEEGGFRYDSISYSDDLPYWVTDDGRKPHLVIPYSVVESDIRFVTPNGYSYGSQFFEQLKSTFLNLIDEGRNGTPKMMTVSLHCRLARPGRVSGLVKFLDYIQSYPIYKDVWIATREQIAEFWTNNHYPLGAGSPVRPWYKAENNKSGQSTIRSMRAKINNKTIPSGTTFIPPPSPAVELGETDII